MTLAAAMVTLTACRNASPPPEAAVTARLANGAAPEAGHPRRLIDAIKEVAGEFSQTIRVARIEAILDVVLAADGHERQGKSRKWPVAVNMTIPREDGAFPLVRMAIETTAGLSLAQVDAVFGQHEGVIVAKESLVEFRDPLGIPYFRVIASLLGGVAPSAPVIGVQMERKPPRAR